MSLIELENVSKKYKRHTQKSVATTLKTFLLHDLWKPNQNNKHDYTWALQGINFKVDKGMTLGVIGRNGSGKSTLLKLMAKILKPDSGKISVPEKVSALIELGVGFHPELTGRENVIIQGIILGMSKNEIKKKLDEIINFAEINEYIDDYVRTYSSGMYVRLGFSVAVHVDPDVMLIDEVLAVGDISFTKKCIERMNYFKKCGKTIVLVTHDVAMVKSWCDQAIWLDSGQIKMIGDPSQVADSYVTQNS